MPKLMQKPAQLQSKHAQTELYALIQTRLLPEVDKAAIDAEIWRLFGEEWCVMFTDLVGFSRLVAEFGIVHFLQTIYESERLLFPVLVKHGGFLLKTEGDSMMVLFKDPQHAVACSVEMQAVLQQYNLSKENKEKVLICIGLGFGNMLRVGDDDVYGAEVNAASKLGEDTAKQGEILVTQAVMQRCASLPNIDFTLLENTPKWLTHAYRVSYSTPPLEI